MLNDAAKSKRLVLVLPWSSFNPLGRSRLVKSSYVWVVIVPILAKLLSAIPRDFELPVFDVQIDLILGVPFSWELLYYAAMFFALANITYSWFCPEIVRQYDRFADFQSEGKGSDQLMRYAYGKRFDDGVFGPSFEGIPDLKLLQFIGAYTNLKSVNPDATYLAFLSSRPIDPIFDPRNIDIAIQHQPSAFWYLRQNYDRYFWKARLAVQILFSFGFAIILWITAQNFFYVWSSPK